ncbi:MAG: TetR/AcrR family transcriptional regulator [Acidimicrobiia bacterium]|nr:TetR/AcrR family transcriptional regulator [Acidimicrobiia bacterium]
MSLRELAGRYSEAQLRTVETALGLFARRGVGGTSLQMIADELGVTKAAVYHQFKSKDAIVRAAVEVYCAPLEEALEDAEGAGGSPKARAALLSRVIDGAVDQRQAVSTLQNDPVLVRVLGEYEPSRQLWSRLFAALLGDDLDEEARVRAAVLSAAIGSVGHIFVRDIDDDTLKVELRKVSRRLILLPG